ncbi:hypothetical protein D9598_19650 [Roseomonas sp. KE0001]|nr:hypothetical protein [Roseomonas sp. KE0001]
MGEGFRRQRLRRRARCQGNLHHAGDHPQAQGPGRLCRPAKTLGVERTFAWLNRNRRLARDFEQTVASAEAFLYAASVMLLVRRLGRSA